nr:hypothetical protein [Acetatifactor sp.]
QEIAFVEKKAVGERVSLARAKLDKGVKIFADYWRNFAWQETREYLEKGRLSVLPPSWDYKDYYGIQYIRMFSNEKIMKLILHYRNKGSVEEWFIKEYECLDTKGNTLNGMVEREIAKIINEKMKLLEGVLDDVKKKWDDSVRNQYSAYYSVHTQFMTSFKQRLEQRVKPKWERYLSDGNIKNKDLSLIQFAVKMGEFSKKELLFLQGKSDIDFRGAILFSNGKTFSQTAKEELGG